MPTAKFRDRLVAMASRRGIAVVGVPAAYSSIWGRQHWLAPLWAQHQQVSGHTAAAVVLGRRALGHSARRRPPASPGVTTSDRRIEAAALPADVESYHGAGVAMTGTGCEGQPKLRRRQGNHPRGARPETATACLAESRSGRTARPDRVSLMGTQQERWLHSAASQVSLKSSQRMAAEIPKAASNSPTRCPVPGIGVPLLIAWLFTSPPHLADFVPRIASALLILAALEAVVVLPKALRAGPRTLD